MTTSPSASTPPSDSGRASSAVVATRWVATGSVLALIMLCLAWELVLAPLRPGGSWLALKALPLCLPLAGLLKNRMYTYRWVTLVIWLYFIEGVVRGWGDKPPSQWLAWCEAALCLVLFVACTMHVRLRQRNAKATAAAADAAAAMTTAGDTLHTANRADPTPATTAAPPMAAPSQ